MHGLLEKSKKALKWKNRDIFKKIERSDFNNEKSVFGLQSKYLHNNRLSIIKSCFCHPYNAILSCISGDNLITLFPPHKVDQNAFFEQKSHYRRIADVFIKPIRFA